MQTEIEGKWLDIDVDEFRKLLKTAGAELVQAERPMARRVFDYPDKRLQKVGGWVRVRNEDDKVTLSYKQLNDRSATGTKEVSVVVDSFDATCSLLESIGLKSKSYQETRRESWKLGDSEIEIDTWPWIPSFVEIEAKDESALKDTAHALGLDYTKVLHGSVETAYQAYYDVSEAEIDSWQEIRFGDVPDWLKEKSLVWLLCNHIAALAIRCYNNVNWRGYCARN